MERKVRDRIQEAVQAYGWEHCLLDAVSYGSGHINDTYLLTLGFSGDSGAGQQKDGRKVILQKMNQKVFRKPEDFYQSGVIFGKFQGMLADYPAETLHETIKGFHDTRARFENFRKAVREDVCGRAALVEEEISFIMAREEMTDKLWNLEKTGKIPLRVTHNDTKLNNVMIDDRTGQGLCVVDLDTVMPGLSVHDFGDSVRFGVSTAAEDEPDLSRVSCDLELFDIYTKGFLEGCQGRLTPQEVELFPMGAKVMTFECGMRFLTDYLEGDHYFKIHRPDHNLDRCRTQLKLVQDMEKKWEIMEQIVRKRSVG